MNALGVFVSVSLHCKSLHDMLRTVTFSSVSRLPPIFQHLSISRVTNLAFVSTQSLMQTSPGTFWRQRCGIGTALPPTALRAEAKNGPTQIDLTMALLPVSPLSLSWQHAMPWTWETVFSQPFYPLYLTAYRTFAEADSVPTTADPSHCNFSHLMPTRSSLFLQLPSDFCRCLLS